MGTICTKFGPPLEPLGLLDRPRLREQSGQIDRHRLTIVRAPAGYGKTTLLAQWFDELRSRDTIVSWLTLDSRERTANNIAGSIAAMLTKDERGRGGLDMFCRNEAFVSADSLSALIERLSGAKLPIYLFLDDVHAIGDEAAAMLGELVHCAPLNTHFIMATRQTKNIELASMRAYGQLFEISHAELRFTAQEAFALLAGSGHEGLSAADVDVLVAKTEGWVTGLKLASFAMAKEPDRQKFLASFSGRRRAVADFFAEDVFAQQNEDVRAFLLNTAVLERLTPPLCDAMTGRKGASTMLRYLEEIGLFIVQLDDEGNWYRYHSLFSEFLQRKLADTESHASETQHRRAAEWLASQHHIVEAMDHALRAKDHELLASILEARSEEFTYTGKAWLIAKYAALLPENVLATRPWTLLAVAWLKIRGLRYAEARRLLNLASRQLECLRVQPDAVPEKIETLRRAIQHREMMFCAAGDDMVKVEDQCHQLIRDFGQSRPYITCTLNGQLIAARREQFRFDNIEKLHVQGCAIANESGYRFALIALGAVAGISLFAAGRTDAAIAALHLGLEESHRQAGPNSSLAALVALPLANIAYERNDLAGACDLVKNHLPVARELCFADQLVAGHIVQARLHGARLDVAEARRTLDHAMNVALECDLERLRLAVLHEQVRLSLRTGMVETAARYAAEAEPAGGAGALTPRAGTTTCDELRATIWVRMAISQDRIAEALNVAKQWRSFCFQRGAALSLVHWNILIAQMLMISGASRAAQRAMREAIATAAPSGLIRCFVDEGSVILTILSEAYADKMQSQHPTDLFAQQVLEAFECRRRPAELTPAHESGLYGRLSGKELEILTLVGCGMRNREIGKRLGLSEGSVKWYMQQVYDKVGIRRRSQAVERARQFGLIA